MKPILIIGEVNPDLILSGYSAFPEPGKEILVTGSRLTLGGSASICAAGLARLEHPIRYLGKCGDDVFGHFALAELQARGVDTSFVITDPASTTGVTVAISDSRDRAFVTALGAIAELRGVSDAALLGCRHLHVSSVYLQEALQPGLEELFRRAREAGLTTSLDPGHDPNERWTGDWERALPLTDVFLPNDVELRALTGESDPERGVRLLAERCPLVVAKLGKQGALAYDGADLVAAPGFQVEVRDTTGAGDSFNAGFLDAWLRGDDLHAALRFGCACGALSTRALGGTTAQPAPAEVAEFLEQRQ